MIRFIASDLDGTLLLNGAQSVDSETLEAIAKLLKAGIYFGAASGRQITSLKRLFEPVSKDMVYIAENGALVAYKDKIIGKTPMDRDLALDIIEDVIERPNCEVLVSGEKTAYIKPKTKEYHHRMTEVVNYHTTIVDKFSDIDEDILKVAVCDLSGISNSREHFFKNWEGKASIAVSGDLYLDFMDTKVNKGNAILQIQKFFNLSKSDCMAFGDNYNDITMLDNVKYSYVMEKAVSDIKKHGNYETDRVLNTLRERFPSILG